jgi:hypothetical protein
MEGGSPLRSGLGNRPAWTTLQCRVGRVGPSGRSKEGKDGGWKPAALGLLGNRPAWTTLQWSVGRLGPWAEF